MGHTLVPRFSKQERITKLSVAKCEAPIFHTWPPTWPITGFDLQISRRASVANIAGIVSQTILSTSPGRIFKIPANKRNRLGNS